MAIQTGNGQGGIFASINITPLTDIFLVLLIIFMVATAVTIESAAHVDLPRMQQQPANQQNKTVTVTYTADHHIFVNQQPVVEGDLGAAIKEALGKSTDKVVVFDGDARVILGDMVRILDIAKGAGAQSVALAVSGEAGGAATEPESSPTPMAEPEAPAPEAVAPSEGGIP